MFPTSSLTQQSFFILEAALQTFSQEKVFGKYVANLQRTTMSKCDFNKVALQLKCDFNKVALQLY